MTERLKTSKEVALRIRWDPGYDAAAFVVGYEERGADGLREVPLPAFSGEAIPWTRVWVIRRGGEVVWDRRARLDRIFGSGDTPPEQVLARATAPAPLEGALPTWEYGPGGWRPAASREPPERAPRTLRVVTWNVLFDLFDPEALATERRRPALIAALARLDADLIALQEVTPPFLDALLEADWVRAGYLSSDAGGATVEPYGQVLLSRLPLRDLRVIELLAPKRLLVGTLETGAGPLRVAAVHLSSGEGRAPVRDAQLEALDGVAPDLVLGDLNMRDEAEPLPGLLDVWPALRPDEPGFTFDPSRDALSRRVTRSGRPGRLDRALLRPGAWRAAAIETVAPPALDGTPWLTASDHAGLTLTLTRGADVAELGATHLTALAVVPPRAQWAPIQALRRAHDKAFVRWPPHVNVLYGFVPADRVDEAAERVRAIARQHAPFTVRLARFASFQHGKSSTVWLDPEDEPAGALGRLQAELLAAFPRCGGRFDGYTPHLTVGQVRPADPALADARCAEWAADWAPLSFTVDRLALLRRGKETPFEVAREVPLGEPTLDAAPLDPDRLERVRARVAGVVGAGEVELAGSARCGLADAQSDVDLVCVARDHPRDALEARLVAAFPDLRRVPPRLELRLDGLTVDVQCVGREDDAPARAALQTLQEADALLDQVAPEREAFQAFARQVKRWARRRQVYGAAFGFPGGLAWAQLAADAFLDARTSDADPLARLFARCAPWDQPVRNPVDPDEDLARKLSDTTRLALQAELERARVLVDRGRTARAFAAAEPVAETRWIEGRVDEPADLPALAGWLRGELLDWARAAERAGWRVRPRPPITTEGTTLRLAVDLARLRATDHDPATDLAARFAGWRWRAEAASLELE